MQQLGILTNKVPISLVLGIRTSEPEIIVINVSDKKKKNTVYINQFSRVDGYREFNLNLPLSPQAAVITVYNANSRGASDRNSSFRIEKFKTENLQQCPIRMKDNTLSFVELAEFFSKNAGILSSGTSTPSIYRSNDGLFQIDYYNQIIDKKSGRALSTPARIGHTSGVIEVSARDFVGYTVPMRMIILLHEYSHKYLNPSINKPIAYETGADINALNIYLALGYSPKEAHYAFLKVFSDANNPDNKKRYLILNDFVNKYTKGEIAGSCKMKTNISEKK